MIRKVMTLALIAGSMSIAACNTVRGAAADVNSAANAVDNNLLSGAWVIPVSQRR